MDEKLLFIYPIKLLEHASLKGNKYYDLVDAIQYFKYCSPSRLHEVSFDEITFDQVLKPYIEVKMQEYADSLIHEALGIPKEVAMVASSFNTPNTNILEDIESYIIEDISLTQEVYSNRSERRKGNKKEPPKAWYSKFSREKHTL